MKRAMFGYLSKRASALNILPNVLISWRLNENSILSMGIPQRSHLVNS